MNLRIFTFEISIDEEQDCGHQQYSTEHGQPEAVFTGSGNVDDGRGDDAVVQTEAKVVEAILVPGVGHVEAGGDVVQCDWGTVKYC